MSFDFLSSLSNILTTIVSIATVIVSIYFLIKQTIRSGQSSSVEETNLKNASLQTSSIKELEGIKAKLIQSPAEKQYELLSQYHSQGLDQSKISFWFSLIFAALGFSVIITAVFAMDRSVQFTSQGQTFITLLAGTIIDIVSTLFFVQSNKARELMSKFFDKLRADRKLEEALKLCQEIQDGNIRARLQTLLALKFAEVQFNDSLLSSMLSTEVKEKKTRTNKKKNGKD